MLQQKHSKDTVITKVNENEQKFHFPRHSVDIGLNKATTLKKE